MQLGGPPDLMTKAVDEYNAIEDPDYVPTEEFSAFLRASTFDCTTCGNGFELTEEASIGETPGKLLDQETVCEDCGP
jgi:hypothetical protein